MHSVLANKVLNSDLPVDLFVALSVKTIVEH